MNLSEWLKANLNARIDRTVTVVTEDEIWEINSSAAETMFDADYHVRCWKGNMVILGRNKEDGYDGIED